LPSCCKGSCPVNENARHVRVFAAMLEKITVMLKILSSCWLASRHIKRRPVLSRFSGGFWEKIGLEKADILCRLALADGHQV